MSLLALAKATLPRELTAMPSKVSSFLKLKRIQSFAAFLIICTILLSYIFIQTSRLNRDEVASLHKKSDHERAKVFAEALSTWDKGPPTIQVLTAAAACTPRDITEGLLQHFQHTIRQSGVIDVGANKGYPVTRLALSAQARWVLSIEPDDRNYKYLTRVPVHGETIFKPIRGAVSDTLGKMDMAFHKDRDDFTCFNCLNTSRDEINVQTVEVHTVDSLVEKLDGNIVLFKTDTQGHEASVLSGAQRLLKSGRVQSILIEFDPKLLRKWENAQQAVSIITSAGLRCMSLVFAGLKASSSFPFFGEEVTMTNLPKFWQYVVTQEKYTDLFCLRR